MRNSNLKELAVAAVVGVLILAAGYFLGHAVVPGGRGGTSNADAISLDTSLTTGTSVTVGTTLTTGATTTVGTSGTINYFVLGGLDFAAVTQSFTATSAIPCITRGPWGSATSTLLSFMGQITTGLLGANTFDLSTTTTAGGFGSSTVALLKAHSVASLSQDTVVWHANSATTTPNVLQGVNTDGSSNVVIGASDILTYRIATGTPGTFAAGYYTGTCSYLFMKP